MSIAWKTIDRYFKDNPEWLVPHHLNSFNDFYDIQLPSIFRQKNPITILKKHSEQEHDEYSLQCRLYLGGKDGSKIYYGKPVIYDDHAMHYMYPNEARLRNMTYAMSVHYDVEVEYTMLPLKDKDEEPQKHTTTIEKVFLGRFPIMLRSKYCILSGMSEETRYQAGECRNDPGGYFIIDGKEKVIISQERFADNMINIRDHVNELYSYAADMRTVSDDASKPVRTLSVRIVAPTPTQKNGQIVVNVPNVRKPVPLFILMRALGVVSDKEILNNCVMGIDSNDHLLEAFRASIQDAGPVFTQEMAIRYIAMLTKGKTAKTVFEILSDYFLPNVGELNFTQKAKMLGYIVYRLIQVSEGLESATDRDSYAFKRVEIPGVLLNDLFIEYYKLQQKNIYQTIDKEFHYNKSTYENDFLSLVSSQSLNYFKERIVEQGFSKAFKGNWGSEAHTKRMGVVQDVNRLSFNSFLSHLRKLNLLYLTYR